MDAVPERCGDIVVMRSEKARQIFCTVGQYDDGVVIRQQEMIPAQGIMGQSRVVVVVIKDKLLDERNVKRQLKRSTFVPHMLAFELRQLFELRDGILPEEQLLIF